MRFRRLFASTFLVFVGWQFFAAPNVTRAVDPMDWPNWRGPNQNRISLETGLIDKWNPETGENVLWKCPRGGRHFFADRDERQSLQPGPVQARH